MRVTVICWDGVVYEREADDSEIQQENEKGHVRHYSQYSNPVFDFCDTPALRKKLGLPSNDKPCPDCEGTGKCEEEGTNCCGAKFRWESDICAECGEHAEVENFPCDTCNGTGKKP